MLAEKSMFKTAPDFSGADSRLTLDLLKLKLLALSLAQQQAPVKEHRFFKSFIRNPLE